MPIIETPPPAAAVQAFRAGISWLAEGEERLRDLREAEWFPTGPIPPPHVMEVWTLDGAILDRENPRRTWRFFVSGQHVPLGVVEVAPTDEWAGAIEYEFLAFREGPSLLATARTFARAHEFTRHEADMGLTFLKLPALGAMFLWLQDLATPRPRLKWTPKDWLLAIPPAARGFPADEPEPMTHAVELLKSEVDRVQNTEFVRSLEEEYYPSVKDVQILEEHFQLLGEERQPVKEQHQPPSSLEL